MKKPRDDQALGRAVSDPPFLPTKPLESIRPVMPMRFKTRGRWHGRAPIVIRSLAIPLLVFVSVSLGVGCGSPSVVSGGDGVDTSSMGSLETTSSAASGTSITVPADVAGFRSLATRSESQDVPVVGLRPLGADGRGVEVVVRSESEDTRLDAEDVMAAHWVLRAAIVERMAGLSIDTVGVAFRGPSGEIVSNSAEPVERTIDASWYSPPGIEDTKAIRAIREGIADSLSQETFAVSNLALERQDDGTRVVRVELLAPSMADINERIGELNGIFSIAERLNADSQARIGLLLLEVVTEAGQPAVLILTDFQLTTGTSWTAPEITNRPGTETSPAR